MDFDLIVREARRLLVEREFRACHAACLRAINLDQTKAEPFYILALMTMEYSNFRKALELLDSAADRGASAAAVHAQKARCYLSLNEREIALQQVHNAIALLPEDAETLDTIGVVQSRLGRHAEAVAFYRDATAAAPGSSGMWYNLGAAQQFLGDFSAARAAFDHAIHCDPEDPRPRVAKTAITKQTQEANDIPALRRAWERRDKDDADAALQLAHALAKSHEDLGDIAESVAWLKRGKALKRSLSAERAEADRLIFSAAARLAGQLRICDTASANGTVFVCGMPRTGTTLVDRILSSHPDIESAGELSDFSVVLKRLSGSPGPYVLDEATLDRAADTDLKRVGQRYLERVQGTLGVTVRFIDKMPLNIFFSPAILAALPDARIICLRRNPADTMLSNYRQLFATSFSYYAYAYDLEATAHYVAAFNQLINTLESVLPSGRFRIVDYENIVHDQEQQTRALLAFAGLSFDPRCLNFHENTSAVATASASQVRKPLYNSSIGRWQTFKPEIEEGLAILRQAGLHND